MHTRQFFLSSYLFERWGRDPFYYSFTLRCPAGALYRRQRRRALFFNYFSYESSYNKNTPRASVFFGLMAAPVA